MAAHKPADIEVWVSNNNRDYRKVSGKQFTDGEIFREGTFKEDVVLDLNKELAVMCGLLLKESESVLQPMYVPDKRQGIYFDEVMIE